MEKNPNRVVVPTVVTAMPTFKGSVKRRCAADAAAIHYEY